jgi:RNA polymerase sigma-70 factor (ECF subfamily)
MMIDERGDTFASVYDEHVWDVYAFFGYRLNSREEAEDLVQATFERALRAWRRFDPNRASARTWLLAIAQNLLIDHFRRGSRAKEEPLAEGELADMQLGRAEPADSGLGLEPELQRALEGLGDRERELIALRFGGDLTGPEIAEITGLTLANVQQILSRSLRRMRAELESDRDPGRGDEPPLKQRAAQGR